MAEVESLIIKKIDEIEDLFEIQNVVEEKLPISLFQEIEADLCDKLMHTSSDNSDYQTVLLNLFKHS